MVGVGGMGGAFKYVYEVDAVGVVGVVLTRRRESADLLLLVVCGYLLFSIVIYWFNSCV